MPTPTDTPQDMSTTPPNFDSSTKYSADGQYMICHDQFVIYKRNAQTGLYELHAITDDVAVAKGYELQGLTFERRGPLRDHL